jgi:hypothetical protein
MTKTLLAATLLTLIAGCAGTDRVAEFDQLAAEADNEIKLAAKTGFLWRDTERFLTEAKAARAKGDFDNALKLGRKALSEARLAQQQARENAAPQADFTYRN